jgi:hypothetical protein
MCSDCREVEGLSGWKDSKSWAAATLTALTNPANSPHCVETCDAASGLFSWRVIALFFYPTQF